MVDLQNDKNFTLNTENNNELNNINHVTIIDDTVLDNTSENFAQDLQNTEFSKEPIFSDSNIVENNILNEVTMNANVSTNSNADSSIDAPEPNCLALTVRKDYNLVIVKNIFTASGRLSWKIVLATVVLNILNMLF